MTTVLKVDIDYKAPEWWLTKWEQTRQDILKHFGLKIVRLTKHETTKGQNYFIEVDSDNIPNEIVNCLQFLLGDDHTRVKINAWRIERGVPHWNKIFDRKLWRKGAETIECWYCGNKIPLIGFKDDKRI